MADAVNEAELGRSKQSATPKDHLHHLLSLGWDPNSPLIQRYVRDKALSRELDEWVRKSKNA
jgi:hypothetical protein